MLQYSTLSSPAQRTKDNLRRHSDQEEEEEDGGNGIENEGFELPPNSSLHPRIEMLKTSNIQVKYYHEICIQYWRAS